MDYKHIFFDLDGTLTDPGLGITNCVMYALKHYGIEAESRESLYDFIGPPLVDSFMKHFGFTREAAVTAREIYRKRFVVEGKFENEVYPRISDMLARLVESGKCLYVATSKPEEQAVEILEHFGLARYFVGIYGATQDTTRCTKDAVIAYALHEARLNPSDVIMVGDRCYDVNGARLNGIDTVGVTYGYGTEEELTTSGAVRIVHTVDELTETLL